jgi:hypothetical protein
MRSERWLWTRACSMAGREGFAALVIGLKRFFVESTVVQL